MKKFSRLLTIAVITLLASIFICIPVFADTEYVEWTLSQDGNTLSDGENTYEFYMTNLNYHTERVANTFQYNNPIITEDTRYEVSSHEKGGQIVLLNDYYNPARVYVTEQGKKVLDGFINGNNVKYLLWDRSYNAGDFDEDILSALQNDYAHAKESVSVNVQELVTWDLYEITKHDELYFFTYTTGGIYKNPSTGKLFYIDYDSLTNQYFDANGNFSYRKGYVDMLELDSDTTEYVEACLEKAETISPVYSWEDGGIYYNEEEALSLTPIFYIGIIVLGFVFPLVFLVIGLVFPHIKKFGKPKYWYALSVSAGLWIIVAVVFLVLLI